MGSAQEDYPVKKEKARPPDLLRKKSRDHVRHKITSDNGAIDRSGNDPERMQFTHIEKDPD
jgi:hypothetical protein